MTKVKINSLLVSLVFIPIAAVGQYLGFLIGDLYVYFNLYYGTFAFMHFRQKALLYITLSRLSHIYSLRLCNTRTIALSTLLFTAGC